MVTTTIVTIPSDGIAGAATRHGEQRETASGVRDPRAGVLDDRADLGR